MGGFTSKQEGKHQPTSRDIEDLSRKMKEIDGMVCEKEKKERIRCERDMMVFTFKKAKAEWRRERKRLKEEVKTLRKNVEEKEERIRKMEGLNDGLVAGETCEMGWEWVVKQMSVERALRDEAVERWKQLYLDIKAELDDLIQKTHGEGLYRKAEEDIMMMEELRKEMKVKEGILEKLKERIASMECELYKKEREIDILRQSLRIISSCNSSSNKKKKKKHRLGPRACQCLESDV